MNEISMMFITTSWMTHEVGDFMCNFSCALTSGNGIV